MRTSASWLAAAASVFVAVSPATAQEDTPYTIFQQMELSAGDAEVFAEQVAIVAAAAAEADIGSDFAWNLYRWDNTFAFVSTESSLANMEDDGAMLRAFEGTSVEAKVAAAMEKAGALDVISSNMQVVQVMPDLGYVPDSPSFGEDGPGGVMLVEQWLKGGKFPAFQASAKEFTGFLADAGYGYPVLVTRDVIGDGGFTFVVIFDNLSNFYGDGSLESLMAEQGTAELGEAMAAHAQLITRSRSQVMERLPAGSYQPGNN